MHKTKRKRNAAGQSLLNYPAAQVPRDAKAEISKLIHVLGGPFFSMRGIFVNREFLCRAVRYDEHHVWTSKKIPKGAIVLKCERSAFTEEEGLRHSWDIDEEYKINLVEWQRHRMLYLAKHPEDTIILDAPRFGEKRSIEMAEG